MTAAACWAGLKPGHLLSVPASKVQDGASARVQGEHALSALFIDLGRAVSLGQQHIIPQDDVILTIKSFAPPLHRMIAS